MLIIHNAGTPLDAHYVWHVGEKKWWQGAGWENITKVDWIQADGHELNAIYKNAPIKLNDWCDNLVQTFYGDIAKTLLANL